MSFENLRGFEMRSDYVNELEFKEMASLLKELAAQQGIAPEIVVDHLVRMTPAQTASALNIHLPSVQ